MKMEGEASDVLVHHACIKHSIRFGVLESALGALSMLKYPPADNNSVLRISGRAALDLLDQAGSQNSTLSSTACTHGPVPSET